MFNSILPKHEYLKSDIEPFPSSPRQERTKEFSKEEREAVFK
jgi:hypothetical protein